MILAVALLNGCGSDARRPPPIPDTTGEQAAGPDDAHCRAVARGRADDARANGYGLTIEESVYRETYEECMAWLTRNKPE
jgi:hypothetical protein